MRAIKIDSENQTVSEIEIEEGKSLSAMQAIVDGYIEKAVELENLDTIYVNEEGLMGQPKNFFEYAGAHQPFAGNGVILGCNPKTGDSKSAQTSLADVKAKVKFLTLKEVLEKYDM